MSQHITSDKTGVFTYICIECGIEKLDTLFEPTGTSEVCLDCANYEHDYAHCENCDCIIDIDEGNWQIVNDNTLCINCYREYEVKP